MVTFIGVLMIIASIFLGVLGYMNSRNEKGASGNLDNQRLKYLSTLIVVLTAIVGILTVFFSWSMYTPQAPKFSPPDRIVEKKIIIDGENVYYSFDGKDFPVNYGKKYTGPFEVIGKGTIYAQSTFHALLLGWKTSEVVPFDYETLDHYKERSGQTEEIEAARESRLTGIFVSDKYMDDLFAPLPDDMMCGYGDSSGLRLTYTIEQINNGAIDDKIVINSISDNPTVGNELYFTQIREADTNDLWNPNGLEVEIGKEYAIRVYVHNNNRRGTEMVAKGVHVYFAVPEASGRTIGIQGIISSSNATTEKCWDGVIMTCKDRFHVEVIPGTCKIEGNGETDEAEIDAVNKWGKIGYNSLNGELPGCLNYSQFVGLRVKVVAD